MTTIDNIQQLATERFQLWRKAASNGLTAHETQRVQAITAQLDSLWDSHRREVASVKPVRRGELPTGERAA